MPSGSKKRKSSKKPKPQVGPPELDAGLEEAMANTGEEVGEPSPSPVGIEKDPEAMAERGFDSNELIGKALQEAAKEDFQKDDADRDVGGQGDPPPLAEPEPEIPAAIEVEPPSVIEPEVETAPHQEIPRQIDMPFVESDGMNDVTPEEIKSDKEYDAGPVDIEPVMHVTPDAPLEEIKPDAGIGLDEIESSKESPKLERELELDAAPLGSESGIDKSFMDEETKADATSTDIEPGSGKAADELDVAAAPEDESGIGQPLVEEGDGAPYSAQETDEAPNEVLNFETEPDAHIKPEAEGGESETEEGLREREPVTVAAPTDVETEGEQKQVEELETEEDLKEREPLTEAAPTDFETEGEEKQGEEPETAALTDIEAVTEEAPIEREVEIDAGPVVKVEDSPAEKELETDGAIADVEPETKAAPLDIDVETKTPQAETDALQDEVPQEIDAATLEKETEMDVAASEHDPEEDAAVVEAEPPLEVSPVEIEPEVSAEPAPIEAAPEPGAASIEAVPEPQLQEEPEVHADDYAAPDPEPELEALVKEEPEVFAEDVENSAEIEARSAPLEETESEPKKLDLAEDTSFEPSEAIEPELEVEELDKAKLQDKALVETKAEETGSIETEACQQESTEGEEKAAPEMKPEGEEETIREVELEVKAEQDSVVEAPVERELDEKGFIHTEADQQDFTGIGPDQPGGKEEDGQAQTLAGEPETDGLESYQSSESQPKVADVLEVPVVEEEPPAISASDPKEGDSIPPFTTDLEGEGESTVEVVSENQDSQRDMDLPLPEVINEEELAKEDGVDQEQEVHVGHGEDEGVLASAGNGGEVEVSSEQELGSEQPLPADVVDVEECAKEEPPFSDQELVSEQPQPLINLESAAHEPEKDIGEEEAASSTRAEAGSVLNDSDERAAYEQELPTDFVSIEQETDVPDSKEFDDNVSLEFAETGSREQLDIEPIPADEKVDVSTPYQEEVTSEQPEVLLESAEAAEPAKDLIFVENARAAEPANDLHSASVEEIPSDEQVLSLPQPVNQNSGQDEVYSSTEVLANEEPKADEEEGAPCENEGKVAANSIFPNVAGDALISKASVHLENGQQSSPSSEAPSNGVVENGAELGVHEGEANNANKAEIDAVDSKEAKEVEGKSVGPKDVPDESTLPISEDRDVKDFEAFRQESTREASLPVEIPSQDRGVEVANLKNAERPSGGEGTVNRRTNILGCCGLFDLLLKKN